MKLCSYLANGKPGYGIVSDAGIIDLTRRIPEAQSLRDLLAIGGLAKAAACSGEAADYSLDAVTLAPVIPNPDKIVCVGQNFHEHVQEMGGRVTPNPLLFPRFAPSQTAHGAPIIKPRESEQLDFEGEMAVIIGKAGRRIARDQALGHVAGYACYMDGSVRDWQNHTTQYMPGKNFASTGGFGPWMVTADEIADYTKLTLETRLNGQTVQKTTMDMMINPLPGLIAYISTFMPLVPGDVIVSGTPGGVGAKRNPPLWMRDGDVCEVEISGIGILRNPVVAER